MLFLIEGPLDDDNTDADRVGFAEAARSAGAQVLELPREASIEPGQPRIPGLEPGPFVYGVLYGDTPSPERYAGLHAEALAAGVTLLNDPEQHLASMELDRVLTQLDGLTARTEVITQLEQVRPALARLPLPVFVKGSVGSRKFSGWKACVADTVDEAEALTAKLLSLRSQSRAKVMLRELLPLRRTGKIYEGFPLSREYRLFVLDAEVIASGYYWPFGDPFGELTPGDSKTLRELGREVAVRTRIPWLAVDVAQLDSGDWRVIETADPACAGLSTVSPRGLVGGLIAGLEGRRGC